MASTHIPARRRTPLPPAHPHRPLQAPPSLSLSGPGAGGPDDDGGDLSLASTSALRLDSPPLADSTERRPSVGVGIAFPSHLRPGTLRRSSSHNAGSSSSASASPSAGVDGSPRARRGTLTRSNDLPTSVLAPELLANLRDWIETVAVVNFDLDRGPEFDNCYPPVGYSAEERGAIAFSSFPDHNEKGDTSLTFSWRMPRFRPTRDGLAASGTASHAQSDNDRDAQTEVLYGYCYFCQQRNPSIRRGYAQRSLVLVTRHAHLSGLFTKLVDILGPVYFRDRGGGGAHGVGAGGSSASAAIETAIYNICRWPPPQPGNIELAILNHIMTVEIPLPHQAQYRLSRGLPVTGGMRLSLPIPPPSPASVPILASLPHTSLSELLHDLVSQLWLIWELVVLAEPILVYSTDPRRASEVVQWLVTIIRPLPFAGDWRPFFHIHLPDFAQILNNTKPRPGILLGSTNPIILSAARHYPHILRIGPASPFDGPVQGVFGSLAKSTAGQSFKEAQTSPHGLFSERKRHIKKDTAVLKAVEERMRAGDYLGADALLLQCMSTLTERFLVPLNRYFATLLPADTSAALSTPKRVEAFNTSHFLHSLKTHGTPLAFRRGKMPTMHMHSSHTDATATSSAIAFYEKFLSSPNFLGWLKDRSEAMRATSRMRYLQRLQAVDPTGKSNAEVSDLIDRLETEVRITDQALRASPTSIRQRSASYDVNMHLLADAPTSMPHRLTPKRSQDLRDRSAKLRSQVERVKAIRQATLDSSEDSDGSSLA